MNRNNLRGSRNRKAVSLLVSSLFFSFVTAQEISLTFDHFGVEQGLSHRQVNAVYQDRQGFIWVGTQYGLNRFDGYQFQWWTRENDGLFRNAVDAVAEDAEGFLWVVYHQTDRKRRFYHISHIDLLRPGTRELIPFAEKFGTAFPFELSDIYADFRVRGADGAIYMGSSDTARLIRYHPSTGFTPLVIPSYRSFFPLALTAEGAVWGIADERILLKINRRGETLLRLPYDQNLHHHQIAYDGHDLWIQVEGNALPARFQKVDGENGMITSLDYRDFHLPAINAENGYQRIKYDPAHGLIWGISIYPHAAAFSTRMDGPAGNVLDPLNAMIKQGKAGTRAFFVDRNGQVWLGGDYGLTKIELKKNRFKKYLYTPEPSRPAERIACRGMCRIGDYLLVTTDIKGLYSIDLSERRPPQVYDLANQTGKRPAFSVLDVEGRALWAVEESIVKIHPENNDITILENETEFVDGQVWALYRDRRQRLWMGTENGLAYWDESAKKIRPLLTYHPFKDLTNARVISFVEDRAGFVWLCTNNGLYVLDLEQGITARYWTGGTGPYYLPHDDIRHIHQDEAGIYWLASGGGGLIRWDRQRQAYRQFTRTDGLSNNGLYAVYEDGRQHLWISSDLGVIRFDKNTYQVQTYLEKDGITHHEFNRASHYQDADGRLYFGGLNGITSFDPEDFYSGDKESPPPLVITDFQQFDGRQNKLVDRREELLNKQQIILQPDDRLFYLSFALLTYSRPDQIRYAYQVEGWDEGWQYQRERTLRLGRLPYGRHLLMIKAQAADGQWSPYELHLPITVRRPFYLQGWFLALLVGLLISGIIGIYRFNLRRLLEKREAQQIKEINQVKARFYTNITHEFRTPLTVILGMTEGQEDIPRAMALIRRNGEKLLNLINQLLDLSKLDSGNLRPHYEQINIIAFTRYIGESYQSLAERKDIQLLIDSEIDLLWMDMDEEKYRQIISNLLTNALKFTGAGGRVVLQLTQKEEELMITIEDTGIGIAPDLLPRIFDRFFQGPTNANATSPSLGLPGAGGGTGIGLSVVKEFVELMEGEIAVESVPDQGTTFTIRLPVRRNAPRKQASYAPVFVDPTLAEEPSPPPEPDEKTELPSLLLIEDNPDVVVYIQSLLQPHYEIQIARNGAEGIEQARQHIPDIIISDVMMPGKDGFEVVETLKQDERTSHIPIVLLTAKATREDRIAGLKQGADAYLMKPFDKEELFVRLEKLLELRATLQERRLRAAGPLGNLVTIPEEAPPTPSLDDRFLEKIRQVIEQKIGDADLDIAYLCRAVYLSPAQLHRKMKALTGEPPIGFIRKVRLHKAKHLLETTDLAVSEIAYGLGFTDPNYFSRAFSQEFGMAPSRLREQT